VTEKAEQTDQQKQINRSLGKPEIIADNMAWAPVSEGCGSQSRSFLFPTTCPDSLRRSACLGFRLADHP
jgi:hypothetical protein